MMQAVCSQCGSALDSSGYTCTICGWYYGPTTSTNGTSQPLLQAYKDRQPKGTYVPSGLEWHEEVRRIWAYLDTLNSPDPELVAMATKEASALVQCEALRAAVEALTVIVNNSDAYSTAWTTAQAALGRLHQMGVEV